MEVCKRKQVTINRWWFPSGSSSWGLLKNWSLYETVSVGEISEVVTLGLAYFNSMVMLVTDLSGIPNL